LSKAEKMDGVHTVDKSSHAAADATKDFFTRGTTGTCSQQLPPVASGRRQLLPCRTFQATNLSTDQKGLFLSSVPPRG
jgi:hypothetical protein